MIPKIIVANWKTNPNSQKEAEKIFGETKKNLSRQTKVKIIICPPSIYFSSDRIKANTKNFSLGAQDVSPYIEGAHTGDISAKMLKNYGLSHALVGHSERRAGGENNDVINQKIKALLASKLDPILCVGEKNRDHSMWYLHEVKKQLEEGLLDIQKAQVKKIIIAYEPVWAIGKNALREATSEECQEMIIYIRKVLSDLYDNQTGKKIPILYGGSVDELNANIFLTSGGADGLLVGRASLEPKKFKVLVNQYTSAKK